MTARDLILACLLDAALGDPRWFPHPVRLMGLAIARYDLWVRRMVRGPGYERAAGTVLAVGLPALCYGAGLLVIEAAGWMSTMLGGLVAVVLAWTTLAARDLADHATAVRHALEAGSVESARTAAARIVGRDTAELSEGEVVRATVESVAEGACDGVVAPLAYLALGGPPLALAYKAISTLDSMIGHHAEPYQHVGWASARVDDAANWVPARITALLLVLAAGIVSRRSRTMREAWRILRRDGHKHPSPNAGRPEAAMAGALQVQLGGTNLYGGEPELRPYLGDPGASLHAAHIKDAVVLMWTAFLLALALAVGLLLR